MKTNKSQAIRDHKEANPNDKPGAIMEALKKRKIDVSPAFISTVLIAQKTKGEKDSAIMVSSGSSIGLLAATEIFAHKVGGIEKVEEGLVLLKKFQSK